MRPFFQGCEDICGPIWKTPAMLALAACLSPWKGAGAEMATAAVGPWLEGAFSSLAYAGMSRFRAEQDTALVRLMTPGPRLSMDDWG
jgi:hypothetical protein